jgi:hypothetical protein
MRGGSGEPNESNGIASRAEGAECNANRKKEEQQTLKDVWACPKGSFRICTEWPKRVSDVAPYFPFFRLKRGGTAITTRR